MQLFPVLEQTVTEIHRTRYTIIRELHFCNVVQSVMEDDIFIIELASKPS